MCSSMPSGCLFVQLFCSFRAGPKSAIGENDGHFDHGEYALETKEKEDHLERGDSGEPLCRTGSG